ncbi:hypothetical protein [Adhaeribacter rhizoryzae]|uniref:hypothetical protein n=1 Tax=Adhaeribacter rhizoryzae TaxID=2607907 RepID=UPI00167FE305|nr:hypothetical protein [Adhaeribacter rhizoryzae]
MKLLTLIAAVCLMGTASCSQKTCPAYSKSKEQAPTHFAKDISGVKADANRS